MVFVAPQLLETTPGIATANTIVTQKEIIAFWDLINFRSASIRLGVSLIFLIEIGLFQFQKLTSIIHQINQTICNFDGVARHANDTLDEILPLFPIRRLKNNDISTMQFAWAPIEKIPSGQT